MTSNAIATMLISDRIGRCTRLATIILFIMRQDSGFSLSLLVAVLSIQPTKLIEIFTAEC